MCVVCVEGRGGRCVLACDDGGGGEEKVEGGVKQSKAKQS